MRIVSNLWRDLIHAARSLAKARAFTFVCVTTLGIGMAPVIAIQFGLRVFTTPPPGLDPDSPTPLVELVTTRVGPQRAVDVWSYPDFVDLRDARTGVAMTGWATGSSAVTLPASADATTVVETMFVTPNYLATMSASLARGSGLQPDGEPVAILGYAFWQKHLAADPAVVGKTLTVGRVPHTIAGIAPEGFGGHFPFQTTDLFLPLERHPVLLADARARYDRSREWVHIHGRLSPGVSLEQASIAVSAVTTQLARAYPATNEFRSGVVVPYHPVGHLDGEDAAVIITVWHAMTAIPLLVVCLNVSGMVQVRSAMRERELSIRQAIGASRRRLIQHLLAESIVLATAGGTLAVLVLVNIPPVVAWWVGEPVPAELQAALRPDVSMIAVCGGLCLATSLVFGWLPALRFSRPVIMTVLKDEAGTGGLRAGRAHRITAALQVAVAVPLLVMSAMSLERVRATARADLGFAADFIYAAPLEIPVSASGDTDFQIRKIRTDIAQASGVAATTIADGLPLDFRYRLTRVATETAPGTVPNVVDAHVTRVGDNYLDTMGIALVRGRGFTIHDAAGAEMVTVISTPLADRLFPDGDAIGRQVIFGAPGSRDRPPKMLTVVGVTADFPTSQMSTEREQLLLPLAQHPDVRRDSVLVMDDFGSGPRMLLIARSAAGEPSSKLTGTLERAFRQLDPDFEPASITTGVWLRQNSMDDFLTQSAVAGTTAGIALVLAALGIYGVVGLMVATRTREIAVRVTLGASRTRVMAMIVLDVVKLAAPGVAVGLLIAAAFVRLNGGILGIPLSSLEPLAYLVGAAIATLTAVLASLAPARRAASVQPMVAMRST